METFLWWILGIIAGAGLVADFEAAKVRYNLELAVQPEVTSGSTAVSFKYLTSSSCAALPWTPAGQVVVLPPGYGALYSPHGVVPVVEVDDEDDYDQWLADRRKLEELRAEGIDPYEPAPHSLRWWTLLVRKFADG